MKKGLCRPKANRNYRMRTSRKRMPRTLRRDRHRKPSLLKNIKVPGKDMAATARSSQAFDAMEPFERLHKARQATMY